MIRQKQPRSLHDAGCGCPFLEPFNSIHIVLIREALREKGFAVALDQAGGEGMNAKAYLHAEILLQRGLSAPVVVMPQKRVFINSRRLNHVHDLFYDHADKSSFLLISCHFPC